jgi:beta-lactamase class A
MLRHLERCEDRQKLPRFLPEGTRVAHKTGSDEGVRTDAGILFTPAGPVAIAVLTAENQDRSWGPDNDGDRLCAEVGRAVYEHFDTRR